MDKRLEEVFAILDSDDSDANKLYKIRTVAEQSEHDIKPCQHCISEQAYDKWFGFEAYYKHVYCAYCARRLPETEGDEYNA